MSIVLRIVINAAAIWVATRLLDGLDVVGGDSTGARVGIFLLIAVVFGVVNAVVKPLVKALTLPLYIITLGLFTLVVNALLLMLTAWLSERTDVGLRVDNFGTAVVGALIISVVSFLLSVFVGRRDRRDRDR